MNTKDSVAPLMKSRNPGWQALLNRLPALANSDFPVMILGPSGSGKDVIARQLHSHSPRGKKEFVSVNCAAIQEGLVESELFGHKRGSFTGASEDRTGAFEQANEGTLFLDEIGDLSLSIQAKLLRAIENREIKAVGSDRIKKVNVRIIAATHKNLSQMVSQGNFRADLLYRLNVIRFCVPALKDRPEDIPDLALNFATHFNVRFTEEALEGLKAYFWPGNIRELRNVVARAASMYPQESIRMSMLPLLFDTYHGMKAEPGLPTGQLKMREYLRQIERQFVSEKLRHNKGNQRKTATELGIPKSTLHDMVRRLGL